MVVKKGENRGRYRTKTLFHRLSDAQLARVQILSPEIHQTLISAHPDYEAVQDIIPFFMELRELTYNLHDSLKTYALRRKRFGKNTGALRVPATKAETKVYLALTRRGLKVNSQVNIGNNTFADLHINETNILIEVDGSRQQGKSYHDPEGDQAWDQFAEAAGYRVERINRTTIDTNGALEKRITEIIGGF